MPNTKKNRNNYKNKSKGCDNGSDREKFLDKRSNDREWYKISDGVNSAISNVPFNRFPGTFEPTIDPAMPANSFASAFTNDATNSTPGVLVLNYINAYGGSGTAGSNTVSPANTAAKALYTWVRHQNSGHANYEATDLMLYIMAMDEIYSYYLELKRALAVAQTYEMVNRNIPDLILRALGIDPVDLRANIAVYRGQLNLIAAKISSMAVPNEFTLFRRHALLTSCIFVDSTSRRSQFYIHRLAAIRYYNPTYDSNGGGLSTLVPSSIDTFGNRMAWLSQMIDAVISDDDMNIMSGDILKAYGRENLYTIAEADASETAAFVYDEDVLSQIENSFSTLIDVSTVDIHQANNSVIEEHSFSTSNSLEQVVTSMLLPGDLYFNSHKDEVNSDDCMEWSRLVPGVTIDSVNGIAYVRAGSELVVGYTMFLYSYTPSGQVSVIAQNFGSALQRTTANVKNVVIPLSKFDWHPIVYVYNTTSSGGVTTLHYEGSMGELKKYTLIGNEVRKAMNDVAVMAELGGLVIRQFNTRK